MQIKIVRATENDASLLARMGREIFGHYWARMYSPDQLEAFFHQQYDIEPMREDLRNPNHLHFIAWADDQPAGFMKLSRKQTLADWIAERCLEICRLYVYEKYYHKGIGRALVETAIAIGHAEQMESLVLGVWGNNVRALTFYKKFGFEKIGEHPFQVGDRIDNDWVMRKWLHPSSGA